MHIKPALLLCLIIKMWENAIDMVRALLNVIARVAKSFI